MGGHIVVLRVSPEPETILAPHAMDKSPMSCDHSPDRKYRYAADRGLFPRRLQSKRQQGGEGSAPL